MTQVIHSTLGKGEVISGDNKIVVVDFGGIKKTMLLKFANLTNTDGSIFVPAKVKKEITKTYPTPSEWADDRSVMHLLSDVLKNKKTGEWA